MVLYVEVHALMRPIVDRHSPKSLIRWQGLQLQGLMIGRGAIELGTCTVEHAEDAPSTSSPMLQIRRAASYRLRAWSAPNFQQGPTSSYPPAATTQAKTLVQKAILPGIWRSGRLPTSNQ
jgi:hypothetical protein